MIAFFTLSFLGTNPSNATDYFSNPSTEYYPGTYVALELLNLKQGNAYSMLIGANQNSYDQQWYNFTAISNSDIITIIHFDKQSLKDNNSAVIENLLIELYYNNSRLDFVWYKVHHYNEDIQLTGYTGLVMGSIAFFGSLLLAYVIVKYILVKLL